MIQVGFLGKLSLPCLFLLAILFQGCAAHSRDTAANEIRVNQGLADSWRRHSDEKVARSFEDRNRQIREDRAGDYDWADFVLDILLDD